MAQDTAMMSTLNSITLLLSNEPTKLLHVLNSYMTVILSEKQGVNAVLEQHDTNFSYKATTRKQQAVC